MTEATPSALFAAACGVTSRPVALPGPEHWLVLAVDTLNEGVHFFPDVDPVSLGHKALAVNLSDLAAMGARPLAAVVSVATRDGDAAWLEACGDGLRTLAAEWGLAVTAATVDTGPQAITVEVAGTVARDKALRRDGARPGDDIYVSGTLGDAALAVAVLSAAAELSVADLGALTPRLHRPEPRLVLGQALGGLASAAIDLSDGLLGDLGHCLAASATGATLDLATLPLSPVLRALPAHRAMAHALAGGDDYELCFTAPVTARGAIATIARHLAIPITRIGHIEADAGLRLLPPELAAHAPAGAYTHFAEDKTVSGTVSARNGT